VNEVINSAGVKKPGKFLNPQEVENGLRKVSVIAVLEAYDKEWVDAGSGTKTIRTMLDVLVKSEGDYRNGEELTFSMNQTQITSMKGFFGNDGNAWKGKILRLVAVPTSFKDSKGKARKTIVIDKD
jgi:hypothetical protein